MPNYQAHLAGGAVVYVGLMHILKSHGPSWDIVVPSLLFCLLGALFPDIDIKSKGQKIFYTLLAVCLAWFILQKRYDICSALAVFALLPLLVRHRGIFHNISFLAICSLVPCLAVIVHAPLYLRVVGYYSLFFFAGCVSHIFLDKVVTYIKRKFL